MEDLTKGLIGGRLDGTIDGRFDTRCNRRLDERFGGRFDARFDGNDETKVWTQGSTPRIDGRIVLALVHLDVVLMKRR